MLPWHIYKWPDAALSCVSIGKVCAVKMPKVCAVKMPKVCAAKLPKVCAVKMPALLTLATLSDTAQTERLLIFYSSKAGILMAPNYQLFNAKKMPVYLPWPP